MRFPRFPFPPSVLFARAMALIPVLAGGAVLLRWVLSAGAPGFPGGDTLSPGNALFFVLSGVCLWLCAAPRPPRRPARLLAGALMVGAAIAIARQGPFLQQGPAFMANAGFALTGLSLFFFDRETRHGRGSLQLPLVPILWMGYLGLIGGTYQVSATDSFLDFITIPPAAAFLFLLTALGILVARPRHGLMAVVSSPSLGGLLARIILPVIAVLPFTVGFVRLRGVQSGDYDLAAAFAMFTTTNSMGFAVFTWIAALMLNRLDGRRRQAFESLRNANEELHRVNEALEEKIQEHGQAEEARKKTELQLFQSQKMEAMGTLASGIAHDFNNILTVILLNAETARETAPGDPLLQKSLQEIKKSGTRAADLIRQIMTFGRKTPGEREAVEPAGAVAEAVKMLQHALPPNVQIETSVEPGTPAILADPTQVQQVLLNLGTNAAHAMTEKGGILEIRVKALAVTPDRARLSPDLHVGDYALITVRDTGHGMNEDTVKRVFDPFFTTKPPGKGTGLGLSVVHGIMRLHEGCITVYSEPGRGTVFNLYFPVSGPGNAARANLPPSAEPRRGNGEHLLCVDDNDVLLQTIGRRLERLGYQITCHANPLQALEEFRARPDRFDLVLTDFSMPEMSGRGLALQLLGIRPDLPVVLMSGFLGPEDAALAKASGIHHVLLKPDVLEELDEVIHRLLLEHKSGGSGAP